MIRTPWFGIALVVGAAAVGNALVGQPQPAVPAPPRDPLSYRDVVKKVLPAVVSIEVRSGAAGPKASLPPNAAEEHRSFFNKPDQPDPSGGFGSGVIVDATGVVLTNFHVVDGATEVAVILQDRRTILSKDIRRDAKTDLAVVRIAAEKPLPFLALGDSDSMEVGDRVLAVGAPFGLSGSVTHGIVSAKSRHNLRLNQYEDFLQTDAAINPGNSGGPLVNIDGEVIGINSAIKTKSGGFQGVGLAVSSNLARDVVAQLLKDGVVRRGYLGVGIREAPGIVGVVVTSVYEGSPAAVAGLRQGDVITSVGGAPVTDQHSLPRVTAKLPLDKPVEVAYSRAGRPAVASVTIREQPAEFGRKSPSPNAPKPVAVPNLGIAIVDLTPETAAKAGLAKDTRGVIVTDVDPLGPAAAAGLAKGQVLVKVDATATATAADFAGAAAKADREKGVLIHRVGPTGEVEFVVVRVK